MKCEECREQLVAHIEELSDGAAADQLGEHLRDCPSCQAELAGLMQLQSRLHGAARHQPTASFETDVINQIMRKQARPIRRITMLARKRRVAAAILAAALLGASAWAAHLAYGTYKQYLKKRRTRTYRVEPATTQVVKIRNSKGEVVREIEVTHPPSSVLVHDSHPDAEARRARERTEEAILKAAIAGKTYEFIETVFPPNEPRQFTYELASPDGARLRKTLYFRLERITSWDQYLERFKRFHIEDLAQRQKEIRRLVAQKKGRFLRTRNIVVHFCRDLAADGKKLEVRQDTRNGRLIARIRPLGSDPYQKGFTSNEMDWRDHLKAIEDGLLKLTQKQVRTFYLYEVTLRDGSTHHYADDAPANAEMRNRGAAGKVD